MVKFGRAFALTLYALAILYGCVQGGQDENAGRILVSTGEEFTLRFNQTAYFSEQKMDIFLMDIEDSRCASDVTCIWAGEAKAFIRTTKGQASSDIVLVAGASSSGTTALLSSTSTHYYTITLLGVTPYPKSTIMVDGTKREARLMINKKSVALIKSFEECAAAGFPIMESYPEQCRASDGRNFVKKYGSFADTADRSCIKSEDCGFVNAESGLECCAWAGCGEIDYGEEKWIAVNLSWFYSSRDSNCANKGTCGPQPLCPIRLKNDSWEAKCISNKCEKAQRQKEEAPVFEWSEGACASQSDCTAVEYGCGGGHIVCTNNPAKWKGAISTCEIVEGHPSKRGYSCTCVTSWAECAWVK